MAASPDAPRAQIQLIWVWPAGAWLAVVLVSPGVAWWVAQVAHLPLRPGTGLGVLWSLLGSPLLEELVYRAGLQRPANAYLRAARPGWTERRAGLWANALATACFVLVHAPAHGVTALGWAVPAWVLGELFRQTGRVWPCVGLHAWFNASLWWASR